MWIDSSCYELNVVESYTIENSVSLEYVWDVQMKQPRREKRLLLFACYTLIFHSHLPTNQPTKRK